jgi:predicted SprT family Zn-dependent metalloprotease
VLLNNVDEVRDTILHEIAHALAPGDGHGPKWRMTCLRIGARPKRCYDDASVVSLPRRVARYEMGCVACGWWVGRHRRTRRKYACKKCRVS